MTFLVFNISLTLPHYILITFCKYLIKHKDTKKQSICRNWKKQ